MTDPLTEGRELLANVPARPWKADIEDGKFYIVNSDGNTLGRLHDAPHNELVVWAVNHAEQLLDVAEKAQAWRRHADEGQHGIGGLHYATCAILLNFKTDADPPCDCGSWALRDALAALKEAR